MKPRALTIFQVVTTPLLFSDSNTAFRTGSGYDRQTSFTSRSRLFLSQSSILDCNDKHINNNYIIITQPLCTNS